MNPVEQVIVGFQELVAQVPEFIQPLIVLLAGAVPFVEGEGAALIGVVGGLHPVVAAIAAAAGNFLCVLLVVLLTSRARTAVVSRSTARVEARAEAQVGARVGVPSGPAPAVETEHEAASEPERETLEQHPAAKPESKGRQRFKQWLVRFGVPGASILGPLAIPTQITSAMLAAGGTPRGWILLWQAVAIVLWTSVATLSGWLALQVVTLV